MSAPTPDAQRSATWTVVTSGLSTVLTPSPEARLLVHSPTGASSVSIPAARTISRIEINEDDWTIKIFFLQKRRLLFFKRFPFPRDVQDILHDIRSNMTYFAYSSSRMNVNNTNEVMATGCFIGNYSNVEQLEIIGKVVNPTDQRFLITALESAARAYERPIPPSDEPWATTWIADADRSSSNPILRFYPAGHLSRIGRSISNIGVSSTYSHDGIIDQVWFNFSDATNGLPRSRQQQEQRTRELRAWFAAHDISPNRSSDRDIDSSIILSNRSPEELEAIGRILNPTNPTFLVNAVRETHAALEREARARSDAELARQRPAVTWSNRPAAAIGTIAGFRADFMAGDTENTMALIPHNTAKKSEAEIRARLDFPAMDYATKFNETPGANRDEFFSDLKNYDTHENELIARLTAELKEVQQSMIESGILVRKEGKYVLSPAQRLARGEQATYAFNVAATLRALDPASHSRYVTNDPKSVEPYMKLNGYGLRNIIALLYESIGADAPLCIGVTREDALKAMAQGISDGFRGNNRISEDGKDDYRNNDLPTCGRGNYNSLIAAFLGVIPEVEIQFNIEDVLFVFLKEKLMEAIAHQTKNETEAQEYLGYWTTSEPKPGHPFFEWRAELEEKIDSFCDQFAASIMKTDPNESRIQELKDTIANTVRSKTIGTPGKDDYESILRTVNPTKVDLTKYLEQHPQRQSSLKA